MLRLQAWKGYKPFSFHIFPFNFSLFTIYLTFIHFHTIIVYLPYKTLRLQAQTGYKPLWDHFITTVTDADFTKRFHAIF